MASSGWPTSSGSSTGRATTRREGAICGRSSAGSGGAGGPPAGVCGAAGEVDLAQAQVVDERDDVVRVMTVHQSKGLEFPLVFVPACGAPERFDQAPLLYDGELGLGIRITDEHDPSVRLHTP